MIPSACPSLICSIPQQLMISKLFRLQKYNTAIKDLFRHMGGNTLWTLNKCVRPILAQDPEILTLRHAQESTKMTKRQRRNSLPGNPSGFSPLDFHHWHSPIDDIIEKVTILPAGTYYAVLPDEGAPFDDPGLPAGSPLAHLLKESRGPRSVREPRLFINAMASSSDILSLGDGVLDDNCHYENTTMNGTLATTRSLVLLGPNGDQADIGLHSKESKCNEKVGGIQGP